MLESLFFFSFPYRGFSALSRCSPDCCCGAALDFCSRAVAAGSLVCKWRWPGVWGVWEWRGSQEGWCGWGCGRLDGFEGTAVWLACWPRRVALGGGGCVVGAGLRGPLT